MAPKNSSLPHLQINGKTDDNQLIAIIAWLKITKKIPITQLKKDYFILISKWDAAVTGPFKHLTEIQTKGDIPHRPDIIILNKKGKITLIIELDGSVHHSYGLRKTRIRNNNYKDAKIPFIVIDILDLQYLKKDWFVFLDEEMDKLSYL